MMEKKDMSTIRNRQEYDDGDSSGYLQIEFVSKLTRICVPETTFTLPGSSSNAELNSLLNDLVQEKSSGLGSANFDFLINGILLRTSLKEFVNENQIASEKVIEVECVLREPAPTPDSDLRHEDWVGAVIATRDLVISGCYDNSVNIWSRGEQNLLARVSSHAGPVKCLTIVPQTSDNSYGVCFASGSQDQVVVLWEFEINTKRLIKRQVLKGHERSVEAVCSNRDGSRLASGGFDSLLKIWNIDVEEDADLSDAGEKQPKKRKYDSDTTPLTKTPMVTLSGHREAVTGVDWSIGPGEVVTASWDHSVIVWDLELAGQKNSLTGNKAFTSLSCSPLTGLIVTGSVDRNVRLWDSRTKEGTMVKGVFTSHSGWVSAVDWSKKKENLFVSASYDNAMKMWDVRSPKAPLYDLTGHEDRILCCDWSIPDLLLSGSADSSVKTFRVNS